MCLPEDEEAGMSETEDQANWSAAQWHGKMLVDRAGDKIGKLEDVYVDVETDEPQFGTVKSLSHYRGGSASRNG
jgi:sporulation protein YlmC with PRC-barrel domain